MMLAKFPSDKFFSLLSELPPLFEMNRLIALQFQFCFLAFLLSNIRPRDTETEEVAGAAVPLASYEARGAEDALFNLKLISWQFANKSFLGNTPNAANRSFTE